MGENSKNIGERGEEIIEYLFKELLGYPHYSKGIPINCINESKHHLKEGKFRTTHGIDGLTHSFSPLVDNCLEIGVISSKFTSKPYPNTNLKFKQHYLDLAWTLDCFNNSPNKSSIENNYELVDKTEITGLLFWLSNDDESYDMDTLPSYSKSQFNNEELSFSKIIYIDNSRLKFLNDVLEPVKNTFGVENYDFIYPYTGFNLLADKHKGFGKKFPLSFFSSDIIPLRIIINEKIYLSLSCRKQFEKNEFAKIVGLAKSFNHLQATERTIVTFPDYNTGKHQAEVDEILSSFQDERFINQVFCGKTTNDYRNWKL